jgi:hypothetical protein
MTTKQEQSLNAIRSIGCSQDRKRCRTIWMIGCIHRRRFRLVRLGNRSQASLGTDRTGDETARRHVCRERAAAWRGGVEYRRSAD